MAVLWASSMRSHCVWVGVFVLVWFGRRGGGWFFGLERGEEVEGGWVGGT